MTTLSYETAKRLKDAGFETPNWRTAGDGGVGEHVPNPSLSELIEACGDGISNFSLEEQKEAVLSDFRWLASIRTHGTLRFQGEGPTPEEACSNLFIAIHTSEGG